MKTLARIQEAVEKLPRKDFWKLVKWMEDRQEAVWDQEMVEDAQPGGPLEILFEQAMAEHEAGLTIPMEEFCAGAPNLHAARSDPQTDTCNAASVVAQDGSIARVDGGSAPATQPTFRQ